jgi:hypothetical protein
MIEQRDVAVICEQLDAVAALQSARNVIGDLSLSVERKMYYPYYRFEANCTVPTLFGRKPLSLVCLVDGLTGFGATVDPFSVEQITVSHDSLLRVDIDVDAATRGATRFLSHHLGRRLRMISRFDIQLDTVDRVYKSFWIVRLRDMAVMIDSMTGSIHPLRTRAA